MVNQAVPVLFFVFFGLIWQCNNLICICDCFSVLLLTLSDLFVMTACQSRGSLFLTKAISWQSFLEITRTFPHKLKSENPFQRGLSSLGETFNLVLLLCSLFAHTNGWLNGWWSVCTL